MDKVPVRTTRSRNKVEGRASGLICTCQHRSPPHDISPPPREDYILDDDDDDDDDDALSNNELVAQETQKYRTLRTEVRSTECPIHGQKIQENRGHNRDYISANVAGKYGTSQPKAKNSWESIQENRGHNRDYMSTNVAGKYGTSQPKAKNSWESIQRSMSVNEAKLNDNNKSYLMWCSIVLLVIAAFIAIFLGPSLLPKGQQEDKLSKFRTTFDEIRKEFPAQEDALWPILLSGIKKVEEEDPSQPSTFLLLHEAEEDATPKCLAVKMSKAVTAFLEASDPSPLKFRGEELGANESLLNDYGVLISEQKENITNHRAVIVFNLHKIPATVAQSFHYFCDEYNPVVEKAVYFFTMSVTKKLHSKSNPTYVAESELKNLWQQHLDIDKLQPLIVRLTTMVMMVKPEKGLATSCSA